MYNSIFWVIIAFVIIEFVLKRWVSALNASWFNKPLPTLLQGIFDQDKYNKQQAYSMTNYRFGIISSTISVAISLLVLGFGLYGWLDDLLRLSIPQPLLLCLVFFGIVFIFNTLIDIPFDYYQTFVIEEKFGFNKTSQKTFWLDELKNFLLTAIVGGIIFAIVTQIYLWLPDYFWLLAWAVVSLFSIFMTMFYSEWIVPLFNKQTPLEEGELRTAIENFASQVGFNLTNIYVLDSSKRTTKANAYFSGLGSKKRIVLYDTLIQEMTTEEIVAVLSHEIGHYKHKHTRTMLLISLLNQLLMFALLGYFVGSPALSIAMGGSVPSFELGFLAFGILFTPISTVIGLLLNMLSRHNEYQADAFAKEHGLAEPLMSGLKKLSAKSLSNLQPHPAFVFVNYSHPTLLQRLEALGADENASADKNAVKDEGEAPKN